MFNEDGSLIDTKINLCDECNSRAFFPMCIPAGITFGNGKGGDNIIKCSAYAPIEEDTEYTEEDDNGEI